MREILVISKSPLHRDPRVYKQILFLKEAGRFHVTSAGFTGSGIEDCFFEIPAKKRCEKDLSRFRRAFLLKLRKYDYIYWSESSLRKTYEYFSGFHHRFDLVIANDIPALPLAYRIAIKHGAKLYIDAHEYEPRRNNSLLFNMFLRDYWFSICRRFLPTAEYMTTVSQGIAEEYTRNFNATCHVMMNLPFYENLEPINREDGKIRLIHHGNASKSRKIENMIRLMSHLDSRFNLDLMLIGMDGSYGKYLRYIAGNNSRIRFLPTVEMREIPGTINSYDLGLYLLAPASLNQVMALPNKIFEFIQGRLGLAVWPSQEMVRIIDKYKNGVYSSDFDVKQIADILNRLTHDDVVRMKQKSHVAAKELNSESNRKQFLEIVDSLLGTG